MTANRISLDRFGRCYHQRIKCAADLRYSLVLSEALWVATSAPASQLLCDNAFLAWLDNTHNGRITSREVRDTIQWAFEAFSDVSGIDDRSKVLRPETIDTASEEGSKLAGAYESLANRLGIAPEDGISLKQVKPYCPKQVLAQDVTLTIPSPAQPVAGAPQPADQQPQQANQVQAVSDDPQQADAILVQHAILCQMHLIDLANNFVSFPHLYNPGERAMFEMGTLIMDGREFSFAIRVRNRETHMLVAKSAAMYVLYVSISGPTGLEFEVAVPVTSGSAGNLCVGKRGIFKSRDGRELDAQVVAIIENPVSICEAIVAPFVRLGRLITGKIESITSQAEKKLDDRASTAMNMVGNPNASATPAPVGSNPTGMLFGVGVATAALGSAAAYITKTLAQTPWSAIVIGVLVAVVVVILPTCIVAFLKLRRRDLSGLLEGSGWAINSRMRLTRQQGKTFTRKPRYPKGTMKIRNFG